ncbi:MAG: hypothetical protein N4A44_04550 [Alphaproteobacteria bacterium]|jgi:aspartate/glutamate racemase|nr:hypothetical protein [Alphaproteobacteria bacterium]
METIEKENNVETLDVKTKTVVFLAENEAAFDTYVKIFKEMAPGLVKPLPVYLPSEIKEAKKAPLEKWPEVVYPLIKYSLHKLEGEALDAPIVLCSNDLGLLEDLIIEQDTANLISLKQSITDYLERVEPSFEASLAIVATRNFMNASGFLGYFEDGIDSLVNFTDDQKENINSFIYDSLVPGKEIDSYKFLSVMDSLSKTSGKLFVICACRLITTFMEREGYLSEKIDGIKTLADGTVWVDTIRTVAASTIKELESRS